MSNPDGDAKCTTESPPHTDAHTRDSDPLAFSLCTWNILAQAYAKLAQYPHCPPARLGRVVRRQMMKRVIEADLICPEVLCLQVCVCVCVYV
jgi:mRNA deadenylase 3'-5' endonuclease subunit Ccr4